MLLIQGTAGVPLLEPTKYSRVKTRVYLVVAGGREFGTPQTTVGGKQLLQSCNKEHCVYGRTIILAKIYC